MTSIAVANNDDLKFLRDVVVHRWGDTSSQVRIWDSLMEHRIAPELQQTWVTENGWYLDFGGDCDHVFEHPILSHLQESESPKKQVVGAVSLCFLGRTEQTDDVVKEVPWLAAIYWDFVSFSPCST